VEVAPQDEGGRRSRPIGELPVGLLAGLQVGVDIGAAPAQAEAGVVAQRLVQVEARAVRPRADALRLQDLAGGVARPMPDPTRDEGPGALTGAFDWI